LRGCNKSVLKEQNIIGFNKKQRLNWLGHVERMTEDNNVQKIKRWNPCLKDKLEDLKYAGKMTFGRYKEHEHKSLEEGGIE
jgi:hypothetical protein